MCCYGGRFRPVEVIECVACLGFVTIKTLAGKATMASAREICLLPTLRKRLQPEETFVTPCRFTMSAPNLLRLSLLRTRRWREKGFGYQIFDSRGTRGFGPPKPPLPPDTCDEQLIQLMAIWNDFVLLAVCVLVLESQSPAPSESSGRRK